MINLDSLIKTYKIPLTDFTTYPKYIELIYNKTSINTVPYYIVNGVITYDTQINTLNNLKWDIIYVACQAELNDTLRQTLNIDDCLITIGEFRMLYVTQVNGENSFAVECFYNLENGWKAYAIDKE